MRAVARILRAAERHRNPPGAAPELAGAGAGTRGDSNVGSVTASPSSLTSAAAARALRLSPSLTRTVVVRRGLGLRARDGAILRTDHYAPRLDDAPTVLVRTPYGRGGLTAVAARMLAERGFHVVVSSCRGTGGSSGAFDPLHHERADGLDTVEWLRRQPWFTGRLGTYGPSYVGYTQWAIADVPELAAMATVVTASQFREPTYAGGSFALFTTLTWASLLYSQASPRWTDRIELLRGQPRLHKAFAHLPLGEADRAAIGAEVAFFRRWLSLAGAPSSEVDAYWSEVSHDHRLPAVTAPVLMIGGWHDIFLPWQLRDYAALRAAGARPHLTIGPWTHGSGGLLVESLRESVDWLRAHLRDEPDGLRQRPVRLYVGGAEQWREYDEWPPPAGSRPRGTSGRTAVCPHRSRDRPRSRTASPTTRTTRRRRSAGRCWWRTWPGRATTASWRPGRTCSSTPATC